MMMTPNRRLMAALILVAALVASGAAFVSSLSPTATRSNFLDLVAKESGQPLLPGHNYPPVSFSAPTVNGIIVGHDARHDTCGRVSRLYTLMAATVAHWWPTLPPSLASR